MKKRYISAGLVITLCLAGGIIISQNSATAKVQEKKANHSFNIEKNTEKDVQEEMHYIMYDGDTVEDIVENEFSYVKNSDAKISDDCPHTFTYGIEE